MNPSASVATLEAIHQAAWPCGEHSPTRGAEQGPGGGAAMGLPAAGQHVGIPSGELCSEGAPAVCTPKEDTSCPPAMFAPHSTLRRLFSREGLHFLLSSPNLAVPRVCLKRYFSKERRRVRSGFEMSMYPTLHFPLPLSPFSPPPLRLLQPGAQRAAWEVSRTSTEWQQRSVPVNGRFL